MKKKEKPKYNTVQNIGWMVKMAWNSSRRVLLFCVLTAVLEVLLNLVQLYLAPEVREQGLGVQLLGQAVSEYRPLGKEKLQLRCAPENRLAHRFYERYGFLKVGEETGSRGRLDVMEKYIGYGLG